MNTLIWIGIIVITNVATFSFMKGRKDSAVNYLKKEVEIKNEEISYYKHLFMETVDRIESKVIEVDEED